MQNISFVQVKKRFKSFPKQIFPRVKVKNYVT